MCLGGSTPKVSASPPAKREPYRPPIAVQSTIDPAIIKRRMGKRDKLRQRAQQVSAGRSQSANNRGALQSTSTGLY